MKGEKKKKRYLGWAVRVSVNSGTITDIEILRYECGKGVPAAVIIDDMKARMKAFVSMLNKKKDASPEEKVMASMIAKSYDISDKKYVEPIVEYLLK